MYDLAFTALLESSSMPSLDTPELYVMCYYIGTAECTVTDQSATQITCDLGASVPGAAAVQVTVTGSGNSDSDTEFTYEFDPTSASPDTGWLIL